MSSYENNKRTRLSSIYHNMKTRCTNPNYDKYSYYGGKGISICKEWYDSYEAFEKWAIENGYDDAMTIDRIDVDGDYTPENCRWVSRKAQANNRTNNHLLTYRNKTMTIAEWSEETNISESAIRQRISAGWSVDKALTEPVHKTNGNRFITYNNKTQRLHEWAKELGIKYNTLQSRIDIHHWTIEKAFTTPVIRRG